ncbi:putative lipoprotein [Vibrio campbellii HY01]|nr:putative lipoprotein [Vibrio campbellii HY01]
MFKSVWFTLALCILAISCKVLAKSLAFEIKEQLVKLNLFLLLLPN